MKRMTLAATLSLALVAAPASPQAVQSISAGDKAQGAKAHPELLSQFGGPYEGSQVAYVRRVGQGIAVQSGLSNAGGDFTVTLLNSPVENAFAIPGGYVYVTRQLLALMNSEAELAAVLGHEVGHVAARHSSKRNTRATIGSILAAATQAATGSDLLGRIASTGTQLYTLGYSRSQENQADQLGVRYITAANYNPYAMSTMLGQLGADQSLQARISGKDANAVPTWMSTHPDSAARVSTTRKLALATGRPDTGAKQDTAFLRMLDGLRYDDDPAQGVVDGQTFRQPAMRLKFTAPTGYTIANGTAAVTVQGAAGQAQLKAAAATADLPGFIAQRFTDMGGGAAAGTGEVRTGTANGIAYAVRTERATANNQAVDVSIVAYRFPSATYWLTVITPSGQGLGALAPLVASVAPMTATEAAAIKGRKISIVTIKRGDTIAGLSARMAYPTYQRERFLTLNALTDASPLTPGMLVKIVTQG